MRCGNSSDRRAGSATTLIRLCPGDDLCHALARVAKLRRLNAAVVLSGVGSLTQATLRFADQPTGTVLSGPFEIVSITGTVSRDGLHMHPSIADANGRTSGGHLMPGCKVHTTCELALMELAGWRMRRVFVPATGYRELQATRHRR